VLAGLSDDDPAGVTTYSILDTDFGYQLLWVIPISTALLVLFHLLAIRLAIRSGKGFVALVRARYGHTVAKMAGAVFVLANFGTICAEFAASELLHNSLVYRRPYACSVWPASSSDSCSRHRFTASNTCCSRSRPYSPRTS